MNFSYSTIEFECKNNIIIIIICLLLKIFTILILIIIGNDPSIIDKLIEFVHIIFQKFQITKDNIQIKKIKESNFEYFCCFCSMGRQENLYIKELIEYYKSIGIEKFILGDNNLPNTETFSDIIKNYIDEGLVDIINLMGNNNITQGEFFSDIYQKYKYKCKWITFFDFDEYLVLYYNYGKYISLQEYLTNSIFNDCDSILFNWLMYGDNDYIYYHKRPLNERFIVPDYNNFANQFVKCIVRGNLNETLFGKKNSSHYPSNKIRICNTLGRKLKIISDSIDPPIYINGCLKHFNTKTAEEYIKKIKRGMPSRRQIYANDSIELFFRHNKYTRKKFRLFEKKFNMKFDNHYE